jgi:hypothetical protein
MKHLFYIIAVISLLATLNSCTADEIETEKPKVQADADTEPRIPTGGSIPPRK